MAAILGRGAYRYRVDDRWAKLPPGQEFNADVAAVGVDAQDRVYAFNRGAHPMVVLDREGNFLRSWGKGLFAFPHTIRADKDDNLWIVDRDHGQMMLFTGTGELGLRVSQALYLNTFFEGGNVWDRPSQFDPTRLFRAFGFGAAIVSPLGPIGIDLGYGLDKIDSNGRPAPGWKFHFKLGQFF